MPRITGITLRAGSTTATADVVVDGIAYRDLVLRQKRRSLSVAWPATSKFAPSQLKRLEPQIRRAYFQWLDLAGGDA